MNIGLLYYDDDPTRDLGAKVQAAAVRYLRKFGAPADTCYTHPFALRGVGPQRVGGVRVASLPTVLPHHYWIGRDK